MEQKLINIGNKTYKCGGKCYNITNGGDGRLGIPMHENTRKALKKANPGRVCTGKTFEFSSARLASLWLGLNESAVGHAIKDNYLLKNGKFKAYRKNETS